MRHPGGTNNFSDGQRHPARLQSLHEFAGRWLMQRPLLLGRGPIKQAAVFRHHPLEQIAAWKHPQQILELAACDQDELSTRSK